ncbi:MAG: DNA polymerase I [Candidatus Omnitrophota bacterium]
MSNNTIYLVDGTSICYRSFFAIRLSTSKGIPSGAVFGFYQTLKKILARDKSAHIGICFDVSRKTFRQDKFAAYKIQRQPMPDNLKSQIPLIKKLVCLMGLTIIEKEGFEADDVIASLTERALRDNFKVVIVASDKDMYQLLHGEEATIYDPAREEIFTEDDFFKVFGFPSSRIVDYLALVGDSVDNVPGAKGIGKVGAAKLIKEFATVEHMFENIENISSKTRQILERERDSIFLSKDLVTLRPCEIDLGWQDFQVKEANQHEMYTMFQELEFKSLLKDVAPPALQIKVDVVEKFPADFLRKNKSEPLVCYGDCGYVYFLKPPSDSVYKVELKTAAEILADASIPKISYDFKAQLRGLEPLSVKGLWFDVQLAAYLVDPALTDYQLTTIIAQCLSEFAAEVPAEAVPFFIHRLYLFLHPKLKENGLEKLFFEVEMPLINILYEMQRFGVTIHIPTMEKLSKEVEKRLEEIKKEVFKIAGKDFNLNSPKQLAAILFEELKIPALKKTKTGYSTNEEVLEKLSSEYAIAKLILEYRELSKLETTYIMPLIESVKLHGGKLHAEFNQTATQTGRLSSSSPNLQSIPVKGTFSSYLRSAFTPSFDDGFLVSADYSQIELRILAHFSSDEKLKEAFVKKLDVHRYTASLLFQTGENDISDSQRTIAKRVNFGIIYGMSPYGLSQELQISPQEAENFIHDYFLRYPRVNEYIKNIYQKAYEQGFVTTILGRKRYLPDFHSNHQQLQDFAKRQAVNTPIQGSCADLIKVAMIKIHEEFEAKNFQSQLIMQIHDELVFDVPRNELKAVAAIVKKNMEESIMLSVPVDVDIKIGKNWAQMQEFKGDVI